MAIVPVPGACSACGGGGSGSDAVDAEILVLCDVDPVTGEVLGSAVSVYEYDATGAPVGPPTFVIPGTNDPYVPVGVLQPCPGEVGCLSPINFCFTSSETVDAPGRMYDLSLDMGIGFAVTGILKDLAVAPTNVLWEIQDTAGTQFAADLQAAVQSQFAGSTVTVTPGVIDACTGVGTFAIHIECLRLDQTPPSLVQLQYNAGRDLIQNAAFLTTPPQGLNPPIAFVDRADAASPVSSADVNCTNIADRGWETNDNANAFELWGPFPSGQNTFAGTTPSPRGTAVQEINAFGSGPVPVAGGNAGNALYGQNPDTIWQTFVVPAPGNFTVRVVVGGRNGIENIPIRLSTGDVGAGGIGDIINTSVNAAKVTGPSEPNITPGASNQPWTTFNQTVPLAAGTYTLAFTGPVAQLVPGADNAQGGLFTDMRVFQDAPGTVDDFANDDDTCTVPVTSSNTTCEFWAPRCVNGTIASWYNVTDGEELSNAAFWAQVPAPSCCTSDSSGGGDAVLGNLVHTYLVCGQTDTGPRTLSRVVYTDQNGATLSEQFIDTSGALVTPSSWQPGTCVTAANDPVVFAGFVCDITPGTPAIPAGPDTVFAKNFNGAVDGGNPGVDSFFNLGDGANVTTTPDTAVVGNDMFILTNQATIINLPAGAIDISLEFTDFDAPGQLGFSNSLPTSVAGDAVLQPGGIVDATTVAGSAEVFLPDGSTNVGIQNNAADDLFLSVVNFTIPGTPAVPAVPGTSTTVKQFRRADGSSFYENLDGTDHAVVGTIGECASTTGLVLGEFCYAADQIQGTFSLGNVYGTATGQQVISNDFGYPRALLDVDVFAPVLVQTPGVSLTLSVGHYRIDLGKSRHNLNMAFPAGPGTLTNISPPPITGPNFAPPSPPNLVWAQDVRFLEFDVIGGDVELGTIQFENVRTAVVVQCDGCDGGLTAVDLLTGAAVDVGDFITCEGDGLGDSAADRQLVCATVAGVPGSAFRVEQNGQVSFQGVDGDAVFPTTWTPGPCAGAGTDAFPIPNTQVLCDVNPLPSALADFTSMGILALPNGPTAGTTAGVGWTVDLGTTNGSTYLIPPGGGVTTTQNWTFDTPVNLRFGVNNLNVGAECVQLPVGTVVEFISPDHQYNALTQTLCNLNSVQPAESRFTLNGVTAFPVTSVAGGGGQRGLSFLELAVAEFEVTPFLRTYCQTCGDATTVTDTALDGVTPYVPTGTVGVCDAAASETADCCPVVVGEGCTDVGSLRYTALRLTDGTISLIDSVSGAAVLPGDIVACDTAVVLTAQGRLLAATQVWTPGTDVLGTLTSVSATGLTGTWSYVDANGGAVGPLPAGYTATWTVQDANTLTGPTSITAAAASTVALAWTER